MDRERQENGAHYQEVVEEGSSCVKLGSGGVNCCVPASSKP